MTIILFLRLIKKQIKLEIVKPYLLKNNGAYSYSNISSITTKCLPNTVLND